MCDYLLTSTGCDHLLTSRDVTIFDKVECDHMLTREDLIWTNFVVYEQCVAIDR